MQQTRYDADIERNPSRSALRRWLTLLALLASLLLVLAPQVRLAALVVLSAVSTLLGIELGASWVDAVLFPTRARHNLAIRQLAEELAECVTEAAVFERVGQRLSAWLNSAVVKIVLRSAAVDAPLPANDGVVLSVPIRAHGEVVADVLVGAKLGGELFTSDDQRLLRSAANLTATALSYVRNRDVLERLRRTRVATWEGERAFAANAVAAELVHEVRHSVNFFRSLVASPGGLSIEREDIDIGLEEVARLDRLLSALGRVASGTRRRSASTIRELIARTELLLRDDLTRCKFELEVKAEDRVWCDVDAALQVLLNLLLNAVEAVSTRQEPCVGVVWSATTERGCLTVWDNGPGFEVPVPSLFQPWFTTKPHGTGLGLAVARERAHALGWEIDARIAGERTEFRVFVPLNMAADVQAMDPEEQ